MYHIIHDAQYLAMIRYDIRIASLTLFIYRIVCRSQNKSFFLRKKYFGRCLIVYQCYDYFSRLCRILPLGYNNISVIDTFIYHTVPFGVKKEMLFVAEQFNRQGIVTLYILFCKDGHTAGNRTDKRRCSRPSGKQPRIYGYRAVFLLADKSPHLKLPDVPSDHTGRRYSDAMSDLPVCRRLAVLLLVLLYKGLHLCQSDFVIQFHLMPRF